MTLPVEAVAIIGPQNNPLLIKKFGGSSKGEGVGSISYLRLNFISHTMIDIIEERIAAPTPGTTSTSSPATKQDCYLGLLAVLEDLAVFGYISCTRVKYLIFIQVEDKTIKDVEVKQIFKQMVDLYVRCCLNIFYDPFAIKKITSKAFLQGIEKLVF